MVNRIVLRLKIGYTCVSMAGADAPSETLREQVRKIIFEADTPAGKAFDVALIIAIIASVVAVMIDTIPGISDADRQRLHTAEWIFTIIFTIEYFTRLWCVESPGYYARSFFGFIDLIAILPTYLSLIIPGAEYLLVIRFLRVLRIFRILKLAQHVQGARTIMRALAMSWAKITVFLTAILILVTIIGAVMFLVEGQPVEVKQLDNIKVGQRVWVGKTSDPPITIVTSVTPGNTQDNNRTGELYVRYPNGDVREVWAVNSVVRQPLNKQFESIPKSIYWAIVTLTTVGYGDISPQTSLGQFLAALVMIMGYSIIAVPTGIVSAQMARVDGPHAPNTRSCANCGAEGHRLDAQHCYVCGDELHPLDTEALKQWFNRDA